MNIKPLHDIVVIKRSSAETKTPGGIYIPESSTEKPEQGTVVAAGPGRVFPTGKLVKTNVKENDKVLFPKNAGYTIKIDDEELLFMRESDVFAVVP